MENKKNIELYKSINKFQSILTSVKKDKINPFYKSNYAELSSIFDTIRTPLYENGLAITQTMDVLENNRMVIKTRLMHTSGEFIESTMLLPDITDPQKVGGAITYYRRYSLMAICGLPASDDDGNEASKAVNSEAISEDVLSSIESFIDGREEIKEKILKFCGIKELKEMKQSQVKASEKFIMEYLRSKNEKS